MSRIPRPNTMTLLASSGASTAGTAVQPQQSSSPVTIGNARMVQFACTGVNGMKTLHPPMFALAPCHRYGPAAFAGRSRILARRAVADIFDEINEDLRAERMQNLLRRYAVLLAVAALLVVAGAVGWKYWRDRKSQAVDQTAALFLDATRKGASPEASAAARTEAASEFDSLARTAPDGYRTLSRLRGAALRAEGGDLPAALIVWDQVAADTTADPLLRDLANLMWVQHQVDGAEPALVEGRLAPLVASGNSWRPLALEAQALLALRTGQDGRARDILQRVTIDPSSPDGVRTRAAGILGRMGEPSPLPGAPTIVRPGAGG